ncbi:MAG: nucleotide exchange factor GrpE [Candidatus Schekmanbacteria bacterium]|nr:nucleotide exchange factor GrpE [Candidatus Schekmanbacteria bacterium]
MCADDIKPDETPEEKVEAQDTNNSENLKKELELKKTEAADLYDRLLRKQAEYENSRKRLEKERNEAIRYATEELIRELLPVIDSLEQALSSANKNHDIQALSEGVKLILSQLKAVLQRVGLADLKAQGQPFNPEQHEAVQVIESDEHEDNTVVQELRKGYMLSGRIIRPAMVTVAKKKSA